MTRPSREVARGIQIAAEVAPSGYTYDNEWIGYAADIITAALYQARREALEEAAKMADGHGCIECETGDDIAANIRALLPEPDAPKEGKPIVCARCEGALTFLSPIERCDSNMHRASTPALSNTERKLSLEESARIMAEAALAATQARIEECERHIAKTMAGREWLGRKRTRAALSSPALPKEGRKAAPAEGSVSDNEPDSLAKQEPGDDQEEE